MCFLLFHFSSSSSAMLGSRFLFQMQMAKEKHVAASIPEFPLPGNGSEFSHVRYLVNPSLSTIERSGNSLPFQFLVNRNLELGLETLSQLTRSSLDSIHLHGVIRLDRVFVVDQSTRSELLKLPCPFHIFLILSSALMSSHLDNWPHQLNPCLGFYPASLRQLLCSTSELTFSNQIL